jgi:lactate dehydrogenase-like 2-hydroxyacid dehydrogenase
MTKTILAFFDLRPYGLHDLERDFRVINLYGHKDPEGAIQEYKDSTVAVISWPCPFHISEKIIEALPNLEIIAQFGVGYDNIDVKAAKRRDIIVTNTPDLVTNDTADTALGLMLNVARRFVEADVLIRVGKWKNAGSPVGFLGHRLGGKKVGIVGLGRIGQAIAKRASAFGCEILYTGRAPKDSPYTFISDLKSMAQLSDFLVVCCAANEQTKGLINLEVMNALGSDGYLINVSRGTVVNEEDLLIALRNKAIAGAGLDVFEVEPFVPEPLKSMDNVVLFPHIGTATVETRTEMAQLVIANIKGWFAQGKTLTRVV